MGVSKNFSNELHEFYELKTVIPEFGIKN